VSPPAGRPAHRTGAGAGVLCVLAASVLWGTTGTAATFAPAVGPLAIGAAAMGLGGLLQALTAAPRIARERAGLRANRGVLLAGAAGVAVYPLAFYTSMRLAGVAAGTVVSIGSAPLAAALIERIVDRQRMPSRPVAAIVAGMAGIVLLCVAEGARAHAGAGTISGTVAGVGLGLAAGMTYALYSWAAHRLMRRGVGRRAAMGGIFGLGGLLLLPVLLCTGGPFLGSWANLGVAAYMAVLPMFAGYTLFGWGLSRISASMATTLSLLEPAVAAVLAVLVVGERLPVLGWAGIGLVCGCLALLTAPVEAIRQRRRPPAGSRASRRRVVVGSGKLGG
jgi:DME family drug/metabolite transporter